MSVQKVDVFSYTSLSTVYTKVVLCHIQVINILIALSLSACISPHTPAPIRHSSEPGLQSQSVHYVKKGETLYSIAWQYGLDYKALATNNNIGTDYRIYAGQRLSLDGKSKRINPPKVPPTAKAKSSAQASAAGKGNNKAAAQQKDTRSLSRSDNQSLTNTNAIVNRQKNGAIRWGWPTSGLVSTNFFSGDSKGKGIDIAGKKGDSVSAAARGKVVYAGDGLRGYGNLVIIRHSEVYLSAYAHNDVILVKEGQQVTVGEKIAELGSTGTGAKNREVLHFQIRKNGKPINPVSLLPER